MSGLAVPPEAPSFGWERLPSDNGYANIKVIWHPNLERPGSHFFAKYRIKGQSEWLKSDAQTQEDNLVVRALELDSNYEFAVVSVDGEYTSESLVQEVNIDSPKIEPSVNVATAGWFIGMMLAIAFLLLLLILICIIKRNRGGKYDVHDRELANGRRDYNNDEGGFHEYSQP